MSKSKGRRLAEWLRNLDSDSRASSNTLADDSVTSAKIADDAVINAKIADGAVHTANLADTGVTFAKLHTALVVTESDAIGSNDNDTTIATSAAIKDYVDTQVAGKDALSELSGDSDDITEGSSNLYFTNERVDDRVNSLLTAGTGITLTYNDAANTLTVAGAAQYGDSDVGSYLSANGYATQSTIVAAITDSAPTTLDTLNELAAALGDDANFSTTVTNSIAAKVPLAGGSMTGQLVIDDGNANPLELKRSSEVGIEFNDTSTGSRYLGVNSGNLYYGSNLNHATNNRVLTTGDEGSGNGLDADTLDGSHASAFAAVTGDTFTGIVTIDHNTNNMLHIKPTNGSPWAINIQRDDLGASRVFTNNYSSAGLGWVFEHMPYDYNGGSPGKLWGATNDGSGSGLDADTVDGIQGSNLLTLSGSQTITGLKTLSAASGNVLLLNDTNATNATDANIYFYFQAQGSNLGYVGYGTGSNNYLYITNPSAPIYLAGNSCLVRGGYEVWGTDNDGSGSGLDADTLDGQQGTYYTDMSNASGQFTTISATSASSRDKIRVYPSSNYAIGMQDNITYGHLNDWAMTFQMNDDTQSDRGFWWGDAGHGLNNGAMSLTTNGRATIATSLSIGQGESITGPNSTTLYVGGNTYINNATYGGISIGESPTNYGGWNTQLNVHGSGHSRITVKTANVQMGIYAHDSWHGGVMGHVGTYTNHQLSFICNSNQRAVLTTGGSFSTTVQGTVWGASNDGSGSGLDADTVDGIEGASFLRSDTGDTSTGLIEFERGLGIHREDGVYVNPNSKTKAVYWKFAESSQLNSPPGSGTWRHVATIQGWSQHHSSYPSWQMCFGNGAFGVRQSSSNTAWSSWQTVWTSGNDGSGSGLDADTLDGYNLSTGGVNVVLRTQANGYILHQNWIQVGNGTGLYCPNGAYFYNDTTYGWFARSSNSSSGSVRLQTSNGTNRGWFYADSSYNQGFLTSAGGWGLKMDNSGNVTATGNVTAYSDIRLKEDIKPLEGALAKVLQLRGVQYTRKDTKQKEIGVIAQEIENILPEVVHISDATAQEKDKEEYTDIRSVDYGRMVSVLIEAIKEQQAQIEELKEKLK